MKYKDRIEFNPEIMLGKPVIKGTRITVELLIRKLSEGASEHEIIEAYPSITHEDILAALSYSAAVLASEEILSG